MCGLWARTDRMDLAAERAFEAKVDGPLRWLEGRPVSWAPLPTRHLLKRRHSYSPQPAAPHRGEVQRRGWVWQGGQRMGLGRSQHRQQLRIDLPAKASAPLRRALAAARVAHSVDEKAPFLVAVGLPQGMLLLR